MNGFQIGGLCLEISTRPRRHLTPRLTAFYRVMVYLYYFACKAASRVKSDRLKAVLWHDVVACKDNNKVIDAGTTELLTGLLIGLLIVLLVWMV